MSNKFQLINNKLVSDYPDLEQTHSSSKQSFTRCGFNCRLLRCCTLFPSTAFYWCRGSNSSIDSCRVRSTYPSDNKCDWISLAVCFRSGISFAFHSAICDLVERGLVICLWVWMKISRSKYADGPMLSCEPMLTASSHGGYSLDDQS